MDKREWDEKARKLARYVCRQLCDVHRGAVLVTEEVACVFGNDGGDERANLEVEYIRRALDTTFPGNPINQSTYLTSRQTRLVASAGGSHRQALEISHSASDHQS